MVLTHDASRGALTYLGKVGRGSVMCVCGGMFGGVFLLNHIGFDS